MESFYYYEYACQSNKIVDNYCQTSNGIQKTTINFNRHETISSTSKNFQSNAISCHYTISSEYSSQCLVYIDILTITMLLCGKLQCKNMIMIVDVTDSNKWYNNLEP